jgi:hypothetical protein
MKLINRVYAGAIAATMAFGAPAYATDIEKSGQNEIFDNPFIATGFNPQTRVLTGYLVALRTEPGRTDECKFVFSGKVDKKESVQLVLKSIPGATGNTPPTSSRADLISSPKQQKLVIDAKQLPGECEWILPDVGEPKVSQSGKTISVAIENSETGEWIAVNVIGAKRAYFHKSPDAATAGKAFLVAGDVVYVSEEKPDWLSVKFHGRKKDTVGWIKKTDIVQFTK